MKYLKLFAFIALAVAAFSCKQPEPEFLDLKSEPAATVDTEGGLVSIAFTTNTAWTAEASESWVTLSPTSGEGVEGGTDFTVKASVPKNENTDARTATVTVKTAGLSKTVEITQGQLNALNIGVTEYTVSAEGGDVEVTVSANVDYEVVIPEAVDWVSVVKTKGMVDNKLVLKVKETHEYTEEYFDDWSDNHIVRTANITVKAGELKSVVAIHQKTFCPYFDYTGDWAGLQWSFYDGIPTDIPREGADIVIPVETNIDWRVYFSVWDNDQAAMVDSWDVGWAHLSFDVDKSEIHLVIDENDTYFARDQYLYAECSIDGVPDGNFGGLGQFHQEGKVATGAVATLQWANTFNSAIVAGYNRLAYKTDGGDALLLSDGVSVHAISPADGTYWKAITMSGVNPVSICNDDAGHVIVVDDVDAPMDWNTYVLLDGLDFKVYCYSNINDAPTEILLPNGLYGTLGGFRARGDLATKGSIVGIAGGASYWFGYDIANFDAVANYYGIQNSGATAGPNLIGAPSYAAAITLGDDLHDGLLYRGYDGAESLYFRLDCYNPAWAMGDSYEPWTLASEGGNGGNENQNNIDVVDYNGRKIAAYTQGFHFGYSSNATVYILDVTNPKAPETLLTIAPEEYIIAENGFNGASSADVLLNPTSDGLELYVAHSGMSTLAKFVLTVN
ncbi:MAG: BACON domain-containing protein [Bacteroidales bacterium]|nr:BACON domain-containing protein [Bacteroidales bacterium]